MIVLAKIYIALCALIAILNVGVCLGMTAAGADVPKTTWSRKLWAHLLALPGALFLCWFAWKGLSS